MSDPLKAIICGYERGGTTLVSEILRQHPQLSSGFEGGFLLLDDPKDFCSLEPYVTSLKISWGVSDSDLEYICDGKSWQEVYARLLARSEKVHSEFIFDKTPKYMEFLSDVLSRVDVPCISIVRDPRALFYSWAKRAGMPTSDWCEGHLQGAIERYRSYGHGLQMALETKADRILIIQYELLCVKPVVEIEKILNFIGLNFDPGFIEFSNPQKNIHGKRISADFISEYKDHFSSDICSTIELKLSEFGDWFWNGAV